MQFIMRLPDTLTTGASAWDSVGRAELEKKVAGLMRESDLSGTERYTHWKICRRENVVLDLLYSNLT